MTQLRLRMLDDMRLHGLSEATQAVYVCKVAGLSKHYRASPDTLSDEDIRRYFLHLINDRKLKPPTITSALCAIKFFYEKTLGRQWPVFQLIRPSRRKKLPVVLVSCQIN